MIKQEDLNNTSEDENRLETGDATADGSDFQMILFNEKNV
jgi:hypothetical protein